MSYHAQLAEAIAVLFPAAISGVDYRVQNDGDAPYIKTWNLLSPQPTEQQVLDAVPQIPALYTAQQKTTAKAIVDALTQDGRIQRAVAQLVIDELNVLRAWLASFKVEVAASATLADLKTRVAGLPAMPARTKAQAVAAIKTAVDADA